MWTRCFLFSNKKNFLEEAGSVKLLIPVLVHSFLSPRCSHLSIVKLVLPSLFDLCYCNLYVLLQHLLLSLPLVFRSWDQDTLNQPDFKALILWLIYLDQNNGRHASCQHVNMCCLCMLHVCQYASCVLSMHASCVSAKIQCFWAMESKADESGRVETFGNQTASLRQGSTCPWALRWLSKYQDTYPRGYTTETISITYHTYIHYT